MSVLALTRAEWPAPPGVLAFTTRRSGGVSEGDFHSLNLGLHVQDAADAVIENRRRLQSLLPADCHIQWLQQVHGVAVVTAQPGGGVPAADAAIVRGPGVAAAVLTADCLPVFMLAADGASAAVAHAGWRGLQAGILEETLCQLKVPAGDVMVWLGPAIGACHFEVGDEVRAAFLGAAQAGAGEPDTISAAFAPGVTDGKWQADLYALARSRLAAVGVSAVYGGGECTHCDPDYFSFRRDGRTGRMASLICLNAQ